MLHGAAGAALVGVLAAKVAVVRRGLGPGHRLPVFGLTVFTLLALTWATSAPEVRLRPRPEPRPGRRGPGA